MKNVDDVFMISSPLITASDKTSYSSSPLFRARPQRELAKMAISLSPRAMWIEIN